MCPCDDNNDVGGYDVKLFSIKNFTCRAKLKINLFFGLFTGGSRLMFRGWT